MSSKQVELPFTSPYKKTRLYTHGGKTFFGVWQPPDIVLDGDERVITIDTAQEGRLDTIAYREYGTRELFWAIAHVNQINNIQAEVVAGVELIIPKIDNVRAALQEEDHVDG